VCLNSYFDPCIFLDPSNCSRLCGWNWQKLNLVHAAEQLALKKARWHECVLFGGTDTIIDLALAKIFLI